MKAAPFIVILLFVAGVLWSCTDDDDVARRYTDYRLDVVTYRGAADDGVHFELLRRNDSSALDLMADRGTEVNVAIGQRALLRYDWQNANETGDRRRITVYACSSITTDSLRYAVQPLAYYTAQMEPVKLRSMWRTGDYINMRLQVQFTGTPRHFYLLLDRATAQADTVQCYLVNNTRGDVTYHWRDAYASCFVGNAWSRPSCRVLCVTVNDTVRGGESHFYFEKQQY